MEPLIKFAIATTVALQDGIQEKALKQMVTPFARGLTQQTAWKALSHAGCNKFERLASLHSLAS